jgi:NAD(P)-dependent dehydrogenase (short-subunit alcohol dehydrogenase family)
MTRAMAVEMKDAGIRVNSISLGGVQRSQLDQRIMAD